MPNVQPLVKRQHLLHMYGDLGSNFTCGNQFPGKIHCLPYCVRVNAFAPSAAAAAGY